MYIKKSILIIISCIVAILCLLVVYFNYKARNSALKTIETTESEGKYTQMYYEREFNALKKENRELYDSLKNQKDNISSVVRFKYKNKYFTDTVFVNNNVNIPEIVRELPDNTYTYSSESDTLSYRLQVNSKVEPNWYMLQAEVNDEFTIVNKEYANGQQMTVIESQDHGEISDITAWQKPNKRKWYQRFAVGPAVSVGYDPVNRNVGITIGVGVTYDLLGK